MSKRYFWRTEQNDKAESWWNRNVVDLLFISSQETRLVFIQIMLNLFTASLLSFIFFALSEKTMTPASWQFWGIAISFWITLHFSLLWIKHTGKLTQEKTTKNIETKLDSLTTEIHDLLIEIRKERAERK